jgi:hypothetical protein
MMSMLTLLGLSLASPQSRRTGHDKVFVLEVDREVEAPFVCEAKLPPMFDVERKIVTSVRASPYVTRNASKAAWVLVAIQPILYQYCAKKSNSSPGGRARSERVRSL